MALPILIAIGATLANVFMVIREFRKTAAFVISAAVWASFLWLFSIISDRLDLVVTDMNAAQSGGSSSSLSSLMLWFDKLEYIWPVYVTFKCLGLYLSVRLTALLLHYLFTVWDAVPFKGSAGS